MNIWLLEGSDSDPRLQEVVSGIDEDWKVTVSHDGNQLLAAAKKREVDVVISGCVTNPVSGEQLLKWLKNEHSEALRVLVLPENTRIADVARLAADDSVQQIITSPYSDYDVRRVLNRVLTIRGLIADPQLRAQLGSLKELPSSPAAFMSIRSAIADEVTSMNEIVERLSQSPALSARVLQLANSAMFSRGKPIGDLLTAVQRLGLSALSQLVLSSEVFGALGRNDGLSKRLESQALLASRLARTIAGDPKIASLAASAALLSDIGQLLPYQLLHDHSRKALRIDAPRSDMLGACLLAMWGLPMELVEAVAYRHVPAQIGTNGFDIIGVVHVAAGLAASESIDEEYLASVGVSERLDTRKTLCEELRPLC